MKRICGIATQFGTVQSFMLANLNYCAKKGGYEAFCISQPNDKANVVFGEVKFLPIDIKWGYISPLEFFKTVFRFYRIFKREKFDIIQYATFNAAFCASIAGWLARVPVRINLQWGMSYSTTTGFQHYFRRTIDKITCLFSTSVQPDSKSNLDYAIKDELYPAKKGTVIYNGSACGIDLSKFNIDKKAEWKESVFSEFNLSEYDTIFGYVGRAIPDKGINELLSAFMAIDNPKSCLVLVGQQTRVDELNQEIYSKARTKQNIKFLGTQYNVEKFYAAFDFFVLPSYQEGFGMVVLEAAALAVPTIVTRIKGPTDFVKDRINGLICEPRSMESLKDSLEYALQLPDTEYIKLCENAYETAKRDFDSEVFRKLFLENRNELLSKARIKK